MNLITLHVADVERERPVGTHVFAEPPGWREVRAGHTANGRAYARGPLRVMLSVQEERDGRRWLHVSLSCADRLPSYGEMTAVKEAFIGAHRKAIQVFPPRREHIDDMPFCLHLWSCLDSDPLPDFRRWDAERECWTI